MSIFTGLETARRALMAQQQALNVTNHNIANANTPGFSRQEAVFATMPPYSVDQSLAAKTLEMGTGVKVEDIRRLRDGFLDYQYRAGVKDLGRWEVRRDALQKLEVIINEPSEGGLASVLDGFWQSWQELSKNPESGTVRSVVLQQARTLADTIRHLDRELQQLREDLNQTLDIYVNEINSLGRQIADLNIQIVQVETRSQRANDLRDRRDLLLDQLAKLAGVQVTEKEGGAINVVIGNRGLVEGTRAVPLEVKGSPDSPDLEPVWSDGQPLVVNAGSLLGIVEARSTLIEFQVKIDTLVRTLAEKVNELHTAGYGLDGENGPSFFTSVNGEDIAPGNITVNPELIAQPDRIAAASDPSELPGDGSNALKIAQLQHAPVIGATTSLTDFYNSTVADLGIQSHEAIRMADNQKLLTDQVDQHRQMVSGVSLDEEVANMIRFQHAYNAAARMVTALDEMLEVIISRMGLVGR